MTNITVNGVSRRSASEGDTPLLWYLRDELGLTGTRFGCGAELIAEEHGPFQTNANEYVGKNIHAGYVSPWTIGHKIRTIAL
jgi:hypothetical protein